MKDIKKIVHSDEAYNILDNSSCEGSTWTSGGCAILARAINMIEGYPIYVIFNRNYKTPEHFGVKLPDGSIFDVDGQHKNENSWLNFFIKNEIVRPGELVVLPYIDGMDMGDVIFDDKASIQLANLIKNRKKIRESVRSVIIEFESQKLIKEFFDYIDLEFSFLNENDEPSPTFEWDIAREKIDKSTRFIRSKNQAISFFLDTIKKVKNIPKSIKKRILGYVAISIVSFIGYKSLMDIVYDYVPEISAEIKEVISNETEGEEKEEESVFELSSPRKSSPELIDIIKHEEGSAKHKGEPVLKAYNLGDGMITVGWGHAEKVDKSQFKVGQEISRDLAEELLKSDIEEAEKGLNRILDDWEQKGIQVDITQPMYDAMISMIFNMGIGNFRKSEFIQLVKKGDFDSAKERILTTNVTYPGHIKRREKESQLFSKGFEV